VQPSETTNLSASRPENSAAGTASATRTGAWSRVARRIRVPLGFLFAGFYVWRARPSWASVAIGTSIALVGIAIRALASGQVKKNRELTTTGPYAYVRNPLYLGSIIIGVGFAIAARDIWIAVVLLTFFLLVYVPVIRGEQNFLRDHFSGYDAYVRRVPSLLPRTLRFTGLTRGFARELYLRHREYNSLLGAAAILAVLIAKILWMPG
jgi:protein-S-isoprenylcysteine O-methyltransferase Ste14